MGNPQWLWIEGVKEKGRLDTLKRPGKITDEGAASVAVETVADGRCQDSETSPRTTAGVSLRLLNKLWQTWKSGITQVRGSPEHHT